MSYEDSYISTIYPSFNTLKALQIVEPEKELSIILAKIDFAINELPYPLNEIPLDNLIELIISLQRIAELESRLITQFVGFYRTRLDKIIKNVIIESIFNNGYNGIYFLPNNDSLTKVNKLLGLIYSLNDPLNTASACTLLISDSITVQLLRCLKSTQLSLLGHINDKPKTYCITDSILVSKLNTTYRKQHKVFQRNSEQYEYIYLKFVLINRLLYLVEEACNPSSEVFNYFYELLQHDFVSDINSLCKELMLIMVHMKQILEYLQIDNVTIDEEYMNIRHCLKLIITTIHGKKYGHLDQDKEFSKLLVTYIQIFQKNKVAPISNLTSTSNNSFKKTVLKSSQKQQTFENANYKFHLAKSPKEPEWVKNFYDLKVNNETQLQTTKDIINNEIESYNNTNRIESNHARRGFRRKIRSIWTRSFTKYRNPRLGDQNCKKCKFFPFRYLYHKHEADIYIE